MSITRVCGQCGAEVSGYSTEGLCPRCMLLGGLAHCGDGDELSAQIGPAVSPSEPEVETKLRYFGDYELLGEIARGGMGVVYKARQVTLNRIVAVKMVLTGRLANAAALQRFLAEAEAAANLHHPNIVAIYEVGEHDGQHYFSMEYVEGENLAALVREKPLPATQAARYVRLIGEAIQYAHERGTLHRDLKPSNVLLDSFDHPRITDFGLAKQLTSDSDLTLSGQVLGTPSFMAPEQATGRRGAITSASDVYSLGAILYHLATGRPPFVAESMTETLRLVVEVEPVSPRLLNPGVPRDLETICLKCLEKVPAKRYASAQALADELGRFLRDEPIQARPVRVPEKFWRWCKRKPALAGTVTVAVLAVALGIAGVLGQWKRAETARKQAETNEKSARLAASKSQQVAKFLKAMLKGAGPSVALGRDATMLREILDKTAERVGRDLKDQPEVEATLRSTIGWAYLELGEYAKAEATYREALRLNQSVQDATGEANEEIADCLNGLGGVLYKRVDYAGAEAIYRQKLALEKKLKGEESEGFVNALGGLALTLVKRGNLAEAEQLERQALAILRKYHSETNEEVATLLGNLSWVLMEQQNWSEAEASARQAVAIDKQLFGDKHPDVVQSLTMLGAVLYRHGDLAEAEATFREGMRIGREVFGDMHPTVAGQVRNLIDVLCQRRKWADAEPFCREMLARTRKRHPGDPSQIDYHVYRLVDVLLPQGRFPEAEQLCRESLALARQIYTNSPAKLEHCCWRLEDILSAQGKYAEAEQLAREVLESRRARLPTENDDVASAMIELAIELSDWAWAERARSATVPERAGADRSVPSQLSATNSPAAHAREAETLLRDSLSARIENLEPTSKRLALTKGLLGGALVSVAVTDPLLNAGDRLAKLAEAETLLLEAANRLTTDDKHGRWLKQAPVNRLVRLYKAWDTFAPHTGKGEKAVEWKKKIADFAAERKPVEENERR